MTSQPLINSYFDEPTNTISYLVVDPKTRKAAIIDPVLDYDHKSGKASARSAEAILAQARDLRAEIEWILETHVHADHLSAAAYLKKKTGAKVAIGELVSKVQAIFRPIFSAVDVSTEGAEFDRLLKDGERFQIGELEVEVLHTPGHTPACVSYRIADAVFVGDTLFMPDYGTARADFPGGDARTLYRSIQKLLSLPPETRVFLCHDYKPAGRDHYAWETTIAEERSSNVQIHEGVSEGEFVEMRQARDSKLESPVLLLPSIQVNMRGGHFPPADRDDGRYLKIPVKLSDELEGAA
jgi:glyoxylase-like metal-dependent hydrolase (beta-lactamase superfamily II)